MCVCYWTSSSPKLIINKVGLPFNPPINVHIFVSLLVISACLKCGFAGLKLISFPFIPTSFLLHTSATGTPVSSGVGMENKAVGWALQCSRWQEAFSSKWRSPLQLPCMGQAALSQILQLSDRCRPVLPLPLRLSRPGARAWAMTRLLWPGPGCCHEHSLESSLEVTPPARPSLPVCPAQQYL